MAASISSAQRAVFEGLLPIGLRILWKIDGNVRVGVEKI
jgi:hypothetical protein